MKKLLLAAALCSIGIISFAQCFQLPECLQTVDVEQQMSNNYNGSVCFTGCDTVPNEVNVNNFDYISLNDGVTVMHPINLQYNKNVYSFGLTTNKIAQLHMAGNDTIFIEDYAELRIFSLILNNGGNAVIMGNNTRLKIGSEYYVEGDTVKLHPTNQNKWLYVLGCESTPLPLEDFKFRYADGKLYWNYPGAYLQCNGETVYIGTPQEYTPFKSGLYQVLAPFNKYSHIIKIDLNAPWGEVEPVYYYMGNYYRERPNAPYYGIPRKK